MELDFDKYCVVDGSPTTVLPFPRTRSKVADRKSNCQPKYTNDSTRVSKEFKEISFNRYRSASCRDARSGKSNKESHNALLKRGSVYQSSKEVNFLKKNDYEVSERKKIEFSRGAVSEISLEIIDSLCGSDENSSVVERDRSSVTSQSEQSTSSFCKKQMEFLSESDVLHSSRERERDITLHKSLSSKLALPHSPTYSDTKSSRPKIPKVRFNSSTKRLDPLVKSKSLRSPLSSVNRTGLGTTNVDPPLARLDVTIKSSENDISENLRVEVNSQCEKLDTPCSAAESSPAHLHGTLKLDNKYGVPSFEFSVKSPEEFYFAKSWNVENSLSRVYTFHSRHQRRKSNASSGWGFRDSHKESTVLGQMNVSCYLCTELNEARSLTEKMVTEFVLYDISHLRKSTLSRDNNTCSPETAKSSQVHDEYLSSQVQSKINTQPKHSRESDNSRSSNTCQPPLPSSELHPVQEIAAIVMEVPLEKRESLKFKTGDKGTDQPLPSLLELCQIEEGISDNSSPGTMHVVVPSGNHGSPSSESQGPTPLLERWRLGGRCDCGGWDMACPLNIFSNSNFLISDGRELMDDQHTAEIFPLGKKDNLPAFTMRLMEDGNYAVNFHAELSSLQAFSICVAILHSADASTILGHERSKQTLQSDSLRVFAKEEIKNLIDALSEEDEKLKKVNNKTIEHVSMQSFLVNPPFSPISRV